MYVYVVIAAFSNDNNRYPTARTVGIYRTLAEAQERIQTRIFHPDGGVVSMTIDKVEINSTKLLENKGVDDE